MEKNIAKNLDDILMYLSKSKEKQHWLDLLTILNINKENKDVLFSILANNKYVDFTDILKGDKLIEISMTGREFSHSSSFIRLIKKDNIDKIKKKYALTITTISSIVSIIGVSCSIYFAVVNHDQDSRIKQLEKENTTLRQEINLLKDNKISTNLKQQTK